MDNFKWLDLVCDVQHADWHNDIVIRSDQLEKYRYFNGRKYYRGYIDPESIVGIDYAWAYNAIQKITWAGLLNRLKRFDTIKRGFNSRQRIIEHALNDYSEPRTVKVWRKPNYRSRPT